MLIAEKPDLMRKIKAVYDKNPGLLGADVLDFDAFHGHLMALAPPDYYDSKLAKWDADTLPIIPAEFVYLPADEASARRLSDKIKHGGYDFLVNACDAGREGELIFYSFYEAYGFKLPVKRFWADNTTEVSLKDALTGMRPASDYEGLRKASKFRAQFDWLTGMNFSRAVSIAGKKSINIGRVMSPTLKLVVDRESEIQAFVSEDFWGVSAVFKHPKGEYVGIYVLPPKFSEGRLDSESKANDVVSAAKAATAGEIIAIDTRRTVTKAPTLYSLTELQKDASKMFKFSAKKTLDLAQALYEKQWLSYPRTESRALPTAIASEIDDHLKVLAGISELAHHVKSIAKAHVGEIMKDKTYVDNAKITDHHAIIPTTDAPDLGKMSDNEKKLYMLVAKRFLAIFLPPYVADKTVALTQVNGMTFRSAGTVEVDPGYTALFPKKAVKDALPNMAKGDHVSAGKLKVTKGATKPPERYNTATLLTAMTNIGSTLSESDLRKTLRDSEGIGTPATRAAILEKLEKVNMVTVDSKGYFIPTTFGMNIIAAVGDRSFCSPALTAKWEQKLKQVEQNTFSSSFLTEMCEYVREETASILAGVGKISTVKPHIVVGICPICGKTVISGPNYFLCENYAPPSRRDKDSCTFILRKEVCKAEVTDDMARLLLQRKHTAPVKMVTKTGKPFTAPLTLALRPMPDGTDGYAISPFFEDKKTGEVDPATLKPSDFLGKCPKCDGKVYAGSKFYLCTNKDHGCDFSLAQKIKGAAISPANMKRMLKGGETDYINFTWSTGKVSPAKMILKPDGSPGFIFDKKGT